MSKKPILLAFLAALCLMLLPVVAFAAETNVNITVNPQAGGAPVTEIKGAVNWDQGVIQASGTGVPPAQSSGPAQANAMARRAAVVDAYRNLTELIGGVRVEAETTVKNFEVASDVVRTRISGLIQGAKIVSEQSMPDGSYQVTMQVSLFGANSVAAAIKEQMQPVEILPVPGPSPSYQPPAATIPRYTGVIVDARGLGLERVMSPRIYDESGRIVYGNMYINADNVVRYGMVDYAGSPELVTAATAGNSRAGNNPIIVKAVGLKDFNANVVISQADADMILAANVQAGFFAKTAVVFEQ
ncbi:MAG: hypothetical protein P4N41_11900 [Negativicutes bacterium]|nr:hypothetical protein [Negativicutes bacterium]